MLEATFITDEVSRDLSEAIEFARAEGLAAIDLRMIGETNIIDLDDAVLTRIARQLDRAGLRVAALSTPLFKCPLHDERGLGEDDPFRAALRRWEDHLAMLPRAIQVAERLGTHRLRCFAFLGSEPTRDVCEAILERLEQAERAISGTPPGLRLCIENETSTCARTAEDVGDLVSRLGERFEALWDPGNAYHPGGRGSLLGFEAVRRRVGHIHVKDPRLDGDDVHFVPLGDGAVDYPAQVRAWVASGFSGYVSLEPHLIIGQSSLEGARSCLEYLVPLLERAQDDGRGGTAEA